MFLILFSLNIPNIKLEVGFSFEFVFGNGITNVERQTLADGIKMVGLVKRDSGKFGRIAGWFNQIEF